LRIRSVDQVDLCHAGYPVKQFFGNLLDARREPLDTVSGKRGGDQTAQPGGSGGFAVSMRLFISSP
jgi:hypothetical protein